MAERCARPCATCPWVRKNQTAEARRNSPKGEGDLGEKWYSLKNAKRLWAGYKTGHPTVCHSTDPEAELYGGKAGPKDGKQRICVGGMILVARAMDVVNARARSQVPGVRGPKPWAKLFSRDGMIFWVNAMMFRGSPLGPTEHVMPTEFDGKAAQEVRVPWDDPILNAGALAPLE